VGRPQSGQSLRPTLNHGACLEAPEPVFGRDLPCARGRHVRLVLSVLEGGACGVAQPMMVNLVRCPNKRVGVEQQLQSPPSHSLSSCSGSGSKKNESGSDQPFMKPSWRLGGSSTGTSRTLGLPALAMTMSSPATASSSSRERCVFASWILKV